MSGLRNFSSVLTLVMLAIFGTMVWIALGYPAGARFMPLVVGVPGIVFCLVQLALDMRRDRVVSLREGQPASVLRGPPEEAEEEPEHYVRRELVMGGTFLAFVGGILAFGFWASVPVLLSTFLRYQAGRSWPVALLAAALATAVLWTMFTQILGIRLFAGFLARDVLRLVGL